MKPLTLATFQLINLVRHNSVNELQGLTAEVVEDLLDYHGWAMHGQGQEEDLLGRQMSDIHVSLGVDVTQLLNAMGRPSENIAALPLSNLIDFAVGLLANNWLEELRYGK